MSVISNESVSNIIYILEFQLDIVNGNETIKLISIVRVITRGCHLWKRYGSFGN
jgi:hypothetical protein